MLSIASSAVMTLDITVPDSLGYMGSVRDCTAVQVI